MKIKLTLLFGFLTSTLCLPVFAQGAAFTYQGRPNDGGLPANGTYDLRFVVYDALTFGGTLGSGITNLATGVSNGLFVVNLDFGANIFTGGPFPTFLQGVNSIRAGGSIVRSRGELQRAFTNQQVDAVAELRRLGRNREVILRRVDLAVIQELRENLADELKRRDAENAELKHELVELKQLVKATNHQLSGDAK